MLFLDAPVADFWTDIFPRWLMRYAPSSKHIDEVFVFAAAAAVCISALRKRFPAWGEPVLLSAFAVAASYYLTEHFLKPFFAHPDPQLFLDRVRSSFGWHGVAPSGFPSAHAALAAAALTVIGLYFREARKISILCLAMLDLALVAGKWHYISDVLAGNMLGVTMAMLACEAAWGARTLQERRPH
jgi:membrane-associated phospholipid phosphatase